MRGLRMLPGALTTRATLRVLLPPLLPRLASSGVSGAGSAATAGDSSTTGSSSADNTVTASTRFKRLELHNHTVESDGNLTCQELTEYLAADHVDAFAITDHNTTSGQKKIEQLLEEKHYPISLIRGMEYTTYFGHILCLNLAKYVPWNSIDQHRPELLFEAAREKKRRARRHRASVFPMAILFCPRLPL